METMDRLYSHPSKTSLHLLPLFQHIADCFRQGGDSPPGTIGIIVHQHAVLLVKDVNAAILADHELVVVDLKVSGGIDAELGRDHPNALLLAIYHPSKVVIREGDREERPQLGMNANIERQWQTDDPVNSEKLAIR